MKGSTMVSSGGVRCLMVMYHYVRPLPDPHLPLFKAITPVSFKNQIRYLSKNWSFVSLEDYLLGLTGDQKLPQNCCILTFDDGLRDHFEFVFPILRQLGIPGAFFVSTWPVVEHHTLDVHMIQHLVARVPAKQLRKQLADAVWALAPERAVELLAPSAKEVNRVYHYEPEEATRWIKYVMNFQLTSSLQRTVCTRMFEEEFGSEQEFARQLYLSRDQVFEMSEKGMTIGSHGHKHVAMSACDANRKGEELTLSRELLGGWSSRKVSTFCYPWGGVNHIDAESEGCLARYGYSCALTTLDGVNEGDVSLFYLRRRDCIRVPGAG